MGARWGGGERGEAQTGTHRERGAPSRSRLAETRAEAGACLLCLACRGRRGAIGGEEVSGASLRRTEFVDRGIDRRGVGGGAFSHPPGAVLSPYARAEGKDCVGGRGLGGELLLFVWLLFFAAAKAGARERGRARKQSIGGWRKGGEEGSREKEEIEKKGRGSIGGGFRRAPSRRQSQASAARAPSRTAARGRYVCRVWGRVGGSGRDEKEEGERGSTIREETRGWGGWGGQGAPRREAKAAARHKKKTPPPLGPRAGESPSANRRTCASPRRGAPPPRTHRLWPAAT